MFDPVLVSELQAIGANNSALELVVTAYGGHVGHISSKRCQHQFGDSDRWWAWNRILQWFDALSVD